MKKQADLQKLDVKGISPEALNMLLGGNTRGAFSTPGLVALTAQRAERRRRLTGAIRDPMANLPKQKTKGPAQEVPQGMQLSPMSPGSPMAPSNVAGMFPQEQMMQPQQPQQPQPMTRFASSLRGLIKRSNGDEGDEAPEAERRESLPAGIEEALVNFIAQQGQGIDDGQFHAKAEGLGVDPHEAEEAVYRVLAGLVGGENDIIPGGMAAGMPTSQFPANQMTTGVEIEKEHTPSDAVAGEIAKDHLAETDDYYEPRLENMEKEVESDKEEGKAKGVGEASEDQKAAAYKWGFLVKLAELGLKPSELRRAFEKAAERPPGGTLGGSLVGAGYGTLKGILNAAKGLGSAGLMLSAGIPLLAGSALGYGAYRLGRPRYETPEDIRHTETLALYRRLSQQARSKTRRLLAKRQRQKAPAAGRHEIGNILNMSRSA